MGKVELRTITLKSLDDSHYFLDIQSFFKLYLNLKGLKISVV